MSDRRAISTVNEGTGNQDFTVSTPDINLMTNENTVNVKSLERCLNKRIDREMSKIVDMVKDKIQTATLTVIDSTIARKLELEIRSIKVSSGQDATGVTANSECVEHVEITASSENVCYVKKYIKK